jgi:hypothetical protein
MQFRCDYGNTKSRCSLVYLCFQPIDVFFVFKDEEISYQVISWLLSENQKEELRKNLDFYVQEGLHGRQFVFIL